MKQIFINLPVENIEKSMNFYTQLGFTINPLFTDDHQKCMVWCEQIYVMLQSQENFKSPNKKTIPDTRNYVTATFTLPVESLDKVNKFIDSGLKAGGTEPIPMIDEGFMQLRQIEDPDGHTWGVIYLNLSEFKK